MLNVADRPVEDLRALVERFGLTLVIQPAGTAITGSFWGDSEAGIVGTAIHVRPDTPIHSFLHETCHIICMSPERRECLHKDAGGDDLEEAAVCYLQVLLAAEVDGVGSERLMQDMDSWGYSFRLGSAARWFAEDADDALHWLQHKGLVGKGGEPRYRLRARV